MLPCFMVVLSMSLASCACALVHEDSVMSMVLKSHLAVMCALFFRCVTFAMFTLYMLMFVSTSLCFLGPGFLPSPILYRMDMAIL